VKKTKKTMLGGWLKPGRGIKNPIRKSKPTKKMKIKRGSK